MTPQLEAMQQVLQKIEQYDKIIIGRHLRPDGDAVGSTKGLCRVLRLSYPHKDIRLINSDYAQYLAFLGGEDEQMPDEFYSDALFIAIDTSDTKRISNPKYTLAKELVKIDHHINIAPYGDVSWVEEKRSSACEMIALFCETFRDRLTVDTEAATYIYCGMVTDSGRFQYEGTCGDTMRLAGAMLDHNVDIATLYAQLYLSEFDSLKFQAHVFDKMKITPNGLAYIYVDNAMQQQFALTSESASEAVSFLSGIKGCLGWIAFIDMPDGTVRVRLRSRFMPINPLGEKYRGGGHENASGATLLSPDEIPQVIADGDQMVKQYKATHKGWL